MKIRGVAVCLIACVLAGCGGGENLSLAPVSGVIKLNGEPLEGATVTFTPLETTERNAPTSFGRTDSEGRYTLETNTEDKGAYIGKHRVTIVKEQGGDVDDTDDSIIEFKREIPPEYNDESTLRFEVTNDGTDEANFDLKAPKGWQNRKKKRRDEDEDDDDS